MTRVTVAQTQYADAFGVKIAYQVFGRGPVDLLLIPGFVSHVEIAWEEPLFARFLNKLGGLGRVIFFDKRGTGLSDRVPVASFLNLERRVDDVLAVLDAVGSREAVLYAWSEGGPLSLVFASQHPARTRGLVLTGTAARFAAAPGYAGVDPGLIETFIEACEEDWGNGTAFEFFAPSIADDARTRRWWARYQRFCASPGLVAASLRMHLGFDGRALLEEIQAPTLVLHHRDDLVIPFDCGRYLAEHIPDATLRELKGMDHLYWVGDQDELVGHVREFLKRLGCAIPPRPRRSGIGQPHFGWEAVTESERQVIALVVLGLTNREIATRLHRSIKTIESHLAHVYDKLEVRSRTELVAETASGDDSRSSSASVGFRASTDVRPVGPPIRSL